VLTIGNAFPGSVCTITVHVIASGGGTVLQDITLSVNSSGGTIPYTAALGGSCGKALSNSTSSPTAVTFTVTAPPASTWTTSQSGAIGGDLHAVPSGQYSSTACT
jgi:hypothetical protein